MLEPSALVREYKCKTNEPLAFRKKLRRLSSLRLPFKGKKTIENNSLFVFILTATAKQKIVGFFSSKG